MLCAQAAALTKKVLACVRALTKKVVFLHIRSSKRKKKKWSVRSVNTTLGTCVCVWLQWRKACEGRHVEVLPGFGEKFIS